jgi:hypothetical protein
LIFGTMPFSPWAILAKWLRLEAPQNIQEKWMYYPFQTKIPSCSNKIAIGHVWFVGKLVKNAIPHCKIIKMHHHLKSLNK